MRLSYRYLASPAPTQRQEKNHCACQLKALKAWWAPEKIDIATMSIHVDHKLGANNSRQVGQVWTKLEAKCVQHVFKLEARAAMIDLGTLGKMVKLTTLFGKCFTTYCTIVSIDCASEDTGLPGAKWTGNDWEASKKQIMFQFVVALYQASSSVQKQTATVTYIYKRARSRLASL